MAPPGRWANRPSTQTLPFTAAKVWLKIVEPIRMKITKQLSLAVRSAASASTPRGQAPLRRRQHHRTDRAHRAGLGRRGQADVDRAQHQEDQHQRRRAGQHRALHQRRQPADAKPAIRGRRADGDERRDRHRDDDPLVGRRLEVAPQRARQRRVDARHRPGAGHAGEREQRQRTAHGRRRRDASARPRGIGRRARQPLRPQQRERRDQHARRRR